MTLFVFVLRLCGVVLFATSFGLTAMTLLRPSAPAPLLSLTRYSAAASAGSSLWLRDLDRQADMRLMDTDRLLYALWMPSGEQIAYFFDDARGSAVYLYEVATGETTAGLEIPRLLPLRWSPDGDWLLLYSFSTNQIFAMSYAAGVLDEPVYIAVGSPDALWSPDGARIYFLDAALTLSVIDTACLRGDGLCIARALPAERPPEQLAGWMPDGERLMVASGRRPSGQADLYALNPSDGAMTRLAAYLLPGSPPAWSPDGSVLALALALPVNPLPALRSEPIPGVYLVEDDNPPRLLWAGIAGELSWLPDGDRLAFELISRVGSDRSIWVYDYGDDALWRTTPTGVHEAAPHWVVFPGRELAVWLLLAVDAVLLGALWLFRAREQ